MRFFNFVFLGCRGIQLSRSINRSVRVFDFFISRATFVLIHWISYYVNLQWGLEALGPMLLGSVLIGIQTQRACVCVRGVK